MVDPPDPSASACSAQTRNVGLATRLPPRIKPIGFPDITPELARESGFLGVIDLLKVAKHGKGENIYLIRFHYVRPRSKRPNQRKTT